MSAVTYTPEQVVQRGEELYEREIRANLEQEPSNRGKMLAIDVASGDYELADDSLTALDQLQARHPDAPAYILRVGYPAAVRIGKIGCSTPGRVGRNHYSVRKEVGPGQVGRHRARKSEATAVSRDMEQGR